MGALKHTYLSPASTDAMARVVSFEDGNEIKLNEKTVKTLGKGEAFDIPTAAQSDKCPGCRGEGFEATRRPPHQDRKGFSAESGRHRPGYSQWYFDVNF